MRLPGFIGPAYTLPAAMADTQRCVNLYPELNELKTARPGEIGALFRCPGLRRLVASDDTPVRALYTASDGKLYMVRGNKFNYVDEDFTLHERGTLPTETGRVGIADNGTTLVVMDGVVAYGMTLGGDDWTRNTDPDLRAGDNVVYLDGYFIWNVPDTGQFMISSVNGVAVDPLDYATAEGAPDNLVNLLADHRELWLFGASTVEVFYNSGNSDFPFERIQGAFIEHGCVAKWSPCKLNNTVFWLGGDQRGAGIVWAAQGYQPERISNHALEYALQSYEDISDAVGFAYQDRGHNFYVLNFPTAGKTWVFDTATGQWHERAYLNDGVLEVHRAHTHTYAYGMHIVGDYENGKLYHLDPDTYTDDGDPIRWVRSSPHIVDGLRRVLYRSFQLDAQVGVGVTAGTSGSPNQGQEAYVDLRWSDDGGMTWSNRQTRSMGAIGTYSTRTMWWRLGASRQRVWEVSGTDPVFVALLGAEVTMSQTAS